MGSHTHPESVEWGDQLVPVLSSHCSRCSRWSSGSLVAVCTQGVPPPGRTPCLPPMQAQRNERPQKCTKKTPFCSVESGSVGC